MSVFLTAVYSIPSSKTEFTYNIDLVLLERISGFNGRPIAIDKITGQIDEGPTKSWGFRSPNRLPKNTIYKLSFFLVV